MFVHRACRPRLNRLPGVWFDSTNALHSLWDGFACQPFFQPTPSKQQVTDQGHQTLELRDCRQNNLSPS